jgi:hypothetical protein
MSRRIVAGLFSLAGLVVAAGLTLAQDKPKGPEYLVRGEHIEGCECESVCPCVFTNDTTYGDCRGVITWTVDEGHYGKTDLKGLVFAASLVKSGKNIEKAMGTWEGVIFVPAKGTDEQRTAIVEILKAELGAAFAKIEVRTEAIDVKTEGDAREVTIGKVAHLKIAPIKNKDGKPLMIENAPSPLALPKMTCCKAEVNTYDDGKAKWEFKGRNGFFGASEMKSK